MEIRLGSRTPEAQRVHPGAAPTDDGGVIGDRPYPFGPVPEMLDLAFLVGGRRDAAAKADQILHLGALELPGVAEIQPGLGLLVLPAIDDGLAEQAVVITDAVTMGDHAEGRHALHEAGREPAEAAIAERRVRLQQADAFDIHVEPGERFTRHVEQTEVAQAVDQQAADEKLQREVIHPLLPAGVSLARAIHPAVDGAVASSQGYRMEPVVIGGVLRILANRVGELAQHSLTESGNFFGGGNGCFLRHGQTSVSEDTQEGLAAAMPVHLHSTFQKKRCRFPLHLRYRPSGRRRRKTLAIAARLVMIRAPERTEDCP